MRLSPYKSLILSTALQESVETSAKTEASACKRTLANVLEVTMATDANSVSQQRSWFQLNAWYNRLFFSNDKIWELIRPDPFLLI